MHDRMSNVAEQFMEFCTRLLCWLSDTLQKIIYIMLDFVGRTMELVLAILNLVFQVVCFLRDMCIEAMQTFVNVFRGIVNVITGISCDDVEEFASACIVLLLCFGTVNIAMNVMKNNELNWSNLLGQRPPNLDNKALMEKKLEPKVSQRKKTVKRTNNRYNRHSRSASLIEDRDY